MTLFLSHKVRSCVSRLHKARVSALFFGLGLSMLSGCASTSLQPTEKPIETSATSTNVATKKKQGGYYQEDGPHVQTPPETELLATPDEMPQVEEIPDKHFNRPYVVMGKTYTPITHRNLFEQEGIASWYGKQFHGKKTSSGETYNMYSMTAAHPTLPIPSYVRVTNLDNQRQVIVKINDRGPFHSGRVIDLSYTAALKLGYINQGSTKVKVERILGEALVSAKQNIKNTNQENQRNTSSLTSDNALSTSANALNPRAASSATAPILTASSQPPIVLSTVVSAILPKLNTPLDLDTAPKQKASFDSPVENDFQKRYFLQLANFSTSEAASRMVEEYREKVGTVLSILKESGFHKVVAGPFIDEPSTRTKQKQMRQSGFSSFLLVR